MILKKDIWNSIRRSIQRNGLVDTIRIIRHYILLNKKDAADYVFYFHPWRNRICLRKGSSDFSILRQIIMNGEYDIPFPIKPKVIIDAGANIGLASLFFHVLFPDARIYAIEPDAGNFTVLLKQIGSIPAIKTFQVALWDKREKLSLQTEGVDSWGIQVKQSSGESEKSVNGIDLTSFIKEQGIETIDLLKIDIEGAEWEVFNTDFDYWLKRTRILIIELHEDLRPGCTAIFNNAIKRINGRVEQYGENTVVFNTDLI
ncbi:MAG: hypothetical protein C0523_05190 [Cytophaga sp.]|nr:hypothetical protein [Cytophaga sp.]